MLLYYGSDCYKRIFVITELRLYMFVGIVIIALLDRIFMSGTLQTCNNRVRFLDKPMRLYGARFAVCRLRGRRALLMAPQSCHLGHPLF